MNTGTAKAYSNIAFIKYWGNRDRDLRLPTTGSISLNLKGIETVTSVRFAPTLEADQLILNGKQAIGDALVRASDHLDMIRSKAGIQACARIVSENNFPMGSGIASSASAFAALTLAGCEAAGLSLEQKELSTIARLGSGSASRSIPGGYVEWHAGESHESSYAETIAPVEHWDLVDLVAVVSTEHKSVGSTGGHALAPTSPLQEARINDAARRLEVCRNAILHRDFDTFAAIIEHDTLMMHAVMMTSEPALIYWQPPTLRIMEAVGEWRQNGLSTGFTIDAGANVHVMTTEEDSNQVRQMLTEVAGVREVLEGRPGGSAHLLEQHLID